MHPLIGDRDLGEFAGGGKVLISWESVGLRKLSGCVGVVMPHVPPKLPSPDVRNPCPTEIITLPPIFSIVR